MTSQRPGQRQRQAKVLVKGKEKDLGKGLSSRLLRCALGGELSGPVDSAEESVGAPVWVRGQHSYFLVMFSEPRMKISVVTVMNIAPPYGVGVVVIKINIKMRGKYQLHGTWQSGNVNLPQPRLPHLTIMTCA